MANTNLLNNPRDPRAVRQSSINNQTDPFLMSKNVLIPCEVVSFDSGKNTVIVSLLGNTYNGLNVPNIQVQTFRNSVAIVLLQVQAGDKGLLAVSEFDLQTFAQNETGVLTSAFFIPNDFTLTNLSPPTIINLTKTDAIFTAGGVKWGVADWIQYFNEKVIGTPGPTATTGINAELNKLTLCPVVGNILQYGSITTVPPNNKNYIPQYIYPGA